MTFSITSTGGFLDGGKRTLRRSSSRSTQIFGRGNKAEVPGREATYKDLNDDWEAMGIWGSLQGEGGAGGGQGRLNDGTVGEPVRDPHEPSRCLEEAAHGPGG